MDISKLLRADDEDVPHVSCTTASSSPRKSFDRSPVGLGIYIDHTAGRKNPAFGWSFEEEVKFYRMYESGLDWNAISRNLPGRTPDDCKMWYRNYICGTAEGDQAFKHRLAILYMRYVC
jgi:hypothetical protein